MEERVWGRRNSEGPWGNCCRGLARAGWLRWLGLKWGKFQIPSRESFALAEVGVLKWWEGREGVR